MSHNLTEQQVEEFKEAFQIFDSDGSGSITTKELATVMRSLGQVPTEEDVKQMIEDVDSDKSGTIDFKEFLGLMDKVLTENDTEDDLIQAFRVFDRDGNGFIAATELKLVMSQSGDELTPQELDELINDVCIL